MNRAARFTATAFAVLLGVLAIAWFGGRRYLARSVAQYAGTVRAAGLSRPVTIRFDAKGIPQIHAATDADLYFALGWVHASERLSQMELIRRLARGELSELFGDAAFETDKHQRTVGFARKARRDLAGLTPEELAPLERYTAGVNAWVAQAKVLPPEFVVLRFEPRPWTPEDCLAVALYQTWFSHELMDADERSQKLVEKLGDPVRALLGANPAWSPPTVPDTPLKPGALQMTAASNSWVVAPSRSASKAPLHASDPHLQVDALPGLWYIASLRSDEGTNVTGVTQGGLPFVVMGHNDVISYAFTVASIDIIDYYDETIRGNEVLSARGFVPLNVDRELVKVKGEAKPRIVDVLTTPRGVVVRRTGSKAISIHWAGFDFPAGDLVHAALALHKARTFAQFRDCVTKFGALDVNWVYSDRAGHIGYQLGTPIPVRDYNDTTTRHEASNPAYDWFGYRGLEETPYAYDPPRGWLASCNNRIVSDAWPYDLPGFYDPYRIARAAALLASTPKSDVATMERFQIDDVSVLATRWKKLAAAGGDSKTSALLGTWDGRMDPSSHAAALFEVWWYEMSRALFVDELGNDWKDGRTIQEQVLAQNVASIIDDHGTARLETMADISRRAMAAAVRKVGRRTWGDISTVTMRHPLGQVRVLDWWLGLNRGPFPAVGDATSLDANFMSYDDESGTFRSRVAPSMRFVLDWAHPEKFTINVPAGQSGNPFSPHYDDFISLHRAGQRWIVGSGKVTELRLTP